MPEKNEDLALEEEQIEILDAVEESDSDSDESADLESIEKLTTQVQELEQEKQQLSERNLRIHAEYENFKKRTQREKTAERKYKSQDFVTALLPALDNFERALGVEVTEETKGILEGISMVYNQINEALKAEDVEVIETVGKEFDPNLHHAVMQEEDPEFGENIVIEELQKGYILKDRIIRPAMVKVNK